MDEELPEADGPTVGERLRAAREEKGLSLDDVAAQTRIPRRHLESIENAEWDELPAPTYSIGFAKSYASTVGLDRTEIGDQLRAEMGGQRFASTATEVFEAADPARTMPKWLVIGGVLAVIVLIAVMSWLNSRSLESPEEAQANAPAAATAPQQTPTAVAPAPSPAATANGPVVVTAIDAVWFQVRDKGATLFSGTLQPGQTWTLPPTAIAPVLRTGKPEALKVNVGSAVAPAIGPPATTVAVSLLPADLMKGGAAAPAPATAGTAPAAPPAPKPRPRVRRPAPAAPAPAPPPVAAPPTTNTGQ